MTTYAIDIEHLYKRFGDKEVLNDLELKVKKGEIYAFLGPNGAGKSTLIKILVTLLEPSEGNVLVLGKNVVSDDMNVRLSIGVALQEAALDEAMTGIEFLRVQGAIYGLSREYIEQRIQDLIPLIDIGDALKQPIKTYSGGMKRRLDLASAIIHKPQLLFLDEPTTGLDPISRNRVWQEVKALNQAGVTVFLTTQYLEEADVLADRVGIINQGKVIVEGTPEELKNSVGEDLITIIPKYEKDIPKMKNLLQEFGDIRYAEKEVSVVAAGGGKIIGKIALTLDKNNIEVESLNLRATTLDDVFIKVTGNKFIQN